MVLAADALVADEESVDNSFSEAPLETEVRRFSLRCLPQPSPVYVFVVNLVLPSQALMNLHDNSCKSEELLLSKHTTF